MIQKYIIDKTDLHDLLTGKEIPLQQGGNKARAFCVEVPGGMTNGEVIQALFPQSYFLNDFPFCGSSLEKVYFDDKKSNPSCIKTNEEWWNAPYQKGGE